MPGEKRVRVGDQLDGSQRSPEGVTPPRPYPDDSHTRTSSVGHLPWLWTMASRLADRAAWSACQLLGSARCRRSHCGPDVRGLAWPGSRRMASWKPVGLGCHPVPTLPPHAFPWCSSPACPRTGWRVPSTACACVLDPGPRHPGFEHSNLGASP